jgi:DNA-cytosine methyltransferase
MKITHYDLFAGIGGFSYALDQVFHAYEIKHIFSEIEPFPTAILKKHWPEGTYYGDIADLVADTTSERLQDTRRNTEGRLTKFNATHENKTQELCILTGGFPCQPFSHAGRRKGTADNRYKWPEMFAVIRNVRPDWIIAENVRGLASWNDGLVLETVCTDLESEGYEVQPLIIPACGKGAPHRRERVWIVAHTINSRQGREEQGSAGTSHSVPPEHWAQDSAARKSERTTSDRLDHRPWQKDWREVALATCHDGVDDGLPRKLDGATYRNKPTGCISAAQHRKLRLKACGNAIVPQVAMEIFTALLRGITQTK